MATPRKHWFRVADSLTQEPLTNDELASLIRLMGELNQRWARDGLSPQEACAIVLRPGDLMSCTGSGSLARARRIVHALATRVSLIIDEQGKNTRITWPKWSEFQRLQSDPGENSGKKSPPPQDARRKTQDAPAVREKRQRPSAAAAPSDAPWGPLLNTLSKLDGEPDEKSAWLEHEWPQLEADAETDARGIRSLTIRYYKQYLRGEREFRGWAKRQETKRRMAEFEAEHLDEMRELEESEGYATAHR